MNIKALLEAKANALATHDGVIATVVHVAAMNEIVLEARRELDAFIAGRAAPADAPAPILEEEVADVPADAPAAIDAPVEAAPADEPAATDAVEAPASPEADVTAPAKAARE